MALSNNPIIDNEIVRNHPIAANGFIYTLQQLAQKDYENKNYFHGTDILALGLDEYEIALGKKKSGREKTTDAAIGIADSNKGRASNHRLLLVELRLKYKTTNTLHASEIEKKERHSRQLLTYADAFTHIDDAYCLVFSQDFFQQSIGWLSRIQSEKPCAAKWNTFTPESFLNRFSNNLQPQFWPSEDEQQIFYDFKSWCNNENLNRIESSWNYIRNMIDVDIPQYKIQKLNWISTELKSIVEQSSVFKDPDYFADEESKIYLQIIKEEIGRYINRISELTSGN